MYMDIDIDVGMAVDMVLAMGVDVAIHKDM